jgi:hypothetical protein
MVRDFNLKDTKWITGWRGLPECYVKIRTPGVTTVIGDMIPDPEMEEWVRKMGQAAVDKILTAAGHRGTAMHMFIEHFITTYAKTKDASAALRMTQTTSPPLLLKEGIPQDKIDIGRELFYKFYYSDFANSYAGLIAAELGIWSPTLFYRGLADVFFQDRVYGPVVTDFKTSSTYIKKNSVKELKYKYQLGAYASAIEEMYKDKGLQIKRSTILCVNTKSEAVQEIVIEGKELEEYKEKFKTLVKDWHIKHNQGYLITV